MREKKIRRAITLIIALAVVLVSISGALAADTGWKNPSANAAETAIKVDKTVAVCALSPFESRLPAKIGDTVFYHYKVTNTGDVTLTGITVNDDIYGLVTLGKATLAPGESTVGTITRVVVESDAPLVTNTATATGTDPLGGTVTDSDDCTLNVEYTSELTVTKDADKTTANVGETITYSFTVGNTGDTTISGITLTDSKLGAIALDKTTLAPGETATGSATYTVVEGDFPGPLENTATTSGTDSQGNTVTDSDDASVTLTYASEITIKKTVAKCALCPFESRLPVKIGDTVFYRYIVTNTGDVTLTGITVNDDIYGPVTLGKNTLAPGESTEGTITHVVVESDAPTVTDTATATGTDPLGGTVTDTDDCTINVAIAAPAITVVKTASPTEGAPSTNVTFTINVTNTGNCTLDPVKVVDTLPVGMSYVATGTSPTPDSAVEKPDGTWTITWDNVGPLAASESKTITLIGHIDGDVLGTLTDSVTVTGTPPIGGNVTDSNTADVTALASSIIKE